ncbi:MAG TPA: hypothetical protein VIE13_13535 [Terriglobales bacterium]
MRYLLILMGAIVVALAAKMASENLWWIAIPDALFGVGVAWMAAASLHGQHRPPALPVEAVPPPMPVPPPPPPPPAVAQQPPQVRPVRTAPKKKRRR